MKPRFYITVGMLRKYRACQMACDEFERLFGKKMLVTPENMRKVRESTWLYAGWVFARLTDAARNGSPLYDDALALSQRYYAGRGSGDLKDDARTVKLMNECGKLWARFKAGER